MAVRARANEWSLLMEHQALLEDVIKITRCAGEVIMQIYATNFSVRGKDDSSPVTEADERAEAVILAALRKLTPDIPIVAEEATAAGEQVVISNIFWLVDPLDGTKEFINKNGEFTVNIALIDKGVPVLGVVFAPAIDRLFAGAMGQGAYLEEGDMRRAIQVRPVPEAGFTVVASRSHSDPKELAAFLGDKPIAELRNAGSSLKICLVAAGEADLYPRLGRTMEWDIAAGHAVVRAAGGCLTDLNGKEIGYGKPIFENPHFVVRGLS